MKKVLVFIKNNKNELLLLKGSAKDPMFHESFWYTITGGVEKEDASLIASVYREVKEETNLDIKNILYLNWIFEYECLGSWCEEYAYVATAKDTSNIVLNEENIDYKWIDLETFVDEIKWYSDKAELKAILKAALSGVQYFKVEKREK